MYATTLDKVTGKLAQIQSYARTLATISNAGVDCGAMYLDVLAAAVDGVENLGRCITLQCQSQADNYLPPSSPLLDTSV